MLVDIPVKNTGQAFQEMRSAGSIINSYTPEVGYDEKCKTLSEITKSNN